MTKTIIIEDENGKDRILLERSTGAPEEIYSGRLTSLPRLESDSGKTLLLPKGRVLPIAIFGNQKFFVVGVEGASLAFVNEKKYRLRRHIAFWLFWWLFFGILYSYTAKISLFPNFQRLPISMMDSLFFLISHV